MKRRQFLQTAGVAAAATSIAKPAISQSMPALKWQLTSSFPKSLDTLYGGSEIFAKAVAEATDNKFQIQVFAAGEIVPGLAALDAVQSGAVEMCHTPSQYYVGKDPTFTFATTVPFGLNARMQNSWWLFGGGAELMNDFYKKYSVYPIVAGNTGAQMGGWFRNEIKEVGASNSVSPDLPEQLSPSWVWWRSRLLPAMFIQHWRGGPSMLPNGSAPTMTKSSDCRRSRPTTITRVGGRGRR
jgi:TRAP-type mannitol/chloroaromatic compound transport system substrate-binding protein